MSFIAIISLLTQLLPLIKALGAFIVSAVATYQTGKRIAEQKKVVDQVEQGIDQARNAQTIEEKADAACKIEKSLNPNSTCDQ
jgi:hypothetical protein